MVYEVPMYVMNSLPNKDKFQPLVSIVIPVYNGSNYLAEAINSALAQTYENVEILVVNDGSSDGGKTRDVALSYGDRIRYFEKENGGVSTALNLGIREMRGDYFAWLSHDDVYHPKNILLQMENIFSMDKGFVSACSTASFTDPMPLARKVRKSKKQVLTRPLDHWKRWIYGCSLIIPKSTLQKINCFNENNRTTQDVELVWELLRESEIHILSDILVFRRVHSEQGYQDPKIIKLNIQEGNSLLQKKINEYGVEYFTGLHATRFKKSSVLLFLASKYALDKRRLKYEGPKLTESLIDLSYKSYPVIFSPFWVAKKIPVEWFIFLVDVQFISRRIFGVLKRGANKAFNLSR